MATKKTKKDKVKKVVRKTCLVYCSDGIIELYNDFQAAIEDLTTSGYGKDEIENDFDFYITLDDSIKRIAHYKLIPKGFNIEDVALENDEE
jgi:hypothetical protein